MYFSWLIHLPYQSAISVFAVLSETEIWSNSFHTRDNLPHPFPQNCILEARIWVTRLMQFWSQPVRSSDSVSYHCCCCLIAVVSDSASRWTVVCRLLCSWDFPAKNTGVGCHFLLQGIFLTQGSNPHLLLWQADSLLLNDQGSWQCLLTPPYNPEWVVPATHGSYPLRQPLTSMGFQVPAIWLHQGVWAWARA